VRVTPISGDFVGLGCRLGRTTTEGVSVGSSVLDGGGGGALLTLGGDVVAGAVDDTVVVIDGWTAFVGPPDWRDTSNTADTRIAITATPIAPIAMMASDERYQGDGSGGSKCSVP
jgi:hypothetical protein